MKWQRKKENQTHNEKNFFFDNFTKGSILIFAKSGKKLIKKHQKTLLELETFIDGLRYYLKYKISNPMSFKKNEISSKNKNEESASFDENLTPAFCHKPILTELSKEIELSQIRPTKQYQNIFH